MRTIKVLIALAVLFHQSLMAQSSNKITGPLGVYHSPAGYCYSDSTGTDSILVEDELGFGEIAFPNQVDDNGFGFHANVDSCNHWNTNRVLGIIHPPSEAGVYNQPADTALFAPYAHWDGPGMIQGGQRFSRLSQLYGAFSGVILDDWNGDTAITHRVRDAVQGKQVDADGNVESGSVATTPYNKLYIVIYGSTGANTAALPVTDGVAYWYYDTQNCCYTNLDSDITQLRSSYPHKEIMTGIYLNNSNLGWTDPAGVTYMLQHALDRYDNGDINGILLFAGSQLNKNYMPLSEWNAFALPYWLDSLYYPYLGEGQGALYDCNTGLALTDAFVRVFCKGRVSGDTLQRSRRKTDAAGHYQFGLWAGNRNTDSTYYWLVAEKAGYNNDTIGFWIRRGDTTNIPNVSLCPATHFGAGSEDDVLVFPNPTTGIFTVEVRGSAINGELEIYNMPAKKVFLSAPLSSHAIIDLSSLPNGLYLVQIKTGEAEIREKHILVLVHP